MVSRLKQRNCLGNPQLQLHVLRAAVISALESTSRARAGGIQRTFSGKVDDMTEDKSLRERVTRQGEEALGKLAQDLLENPVVSRAVSAAFETRERATRAQELAMGALNIPSASDLERLTRRLRSVSQRLEGIEDGLDRIEQRIERLGGAGAAEGRLDAIEERLARIEATLGEQASRAG
jgi:predicted  nucleic acid-binding Zn-ribbon protein